MMKTLMYAGAAFALLSLPAAAATVDLSGWTAEEGNGSPAASWNVQGSANDSVFQSENSRPSAFFNPAENAQGKALKGAITVETRNDDDYIGFVLGYNAGEFDSSNADFWLIDWKQGNQSGSTGAGMRLSHVTGNVGAASELDFWGHNGTVSTVQLANSLATTGWVDNQTYDFELIFTSSLIEVKVDGVTELSYSSADHGSAFTDGAFGFYNYSQGDVRYAGITEDVAPPPTSAVPLPASAPLVLAGLASLGFLRRRRRA